MIDPRENARHRPGATGQAEQLLRLIEDPNLRWCDVPGGGNLIQQLQLNPDDPHLLELVSLYARRQAQRSQAEGDVFRANDPPVGQWLYGPGSVRFGQLHSGCPIGLPARHFTSNLLVAGRTGSGKTTLTEQVALQLAGCGYCVVVLDRKRRWRRLLAHSDRPGQVTVLRLGDLKIALVQPPPGVTPLNWVNQTIRVIAQAYARLAAQRPFSKIAKNELDSRSDGQWPSLRHLIEKVWTADFGRGPRAADYRTSIGNTLEDLHAHAGHVFACGASDMLEQIFSRPGLFVIEVEELTTAHLGFFAAYLQQWVYTWHLAGQGGSQPVVFILEDATSMADRQRDRETPGGVGLLGENMYLSRELGVGAIVVVHALRTLSSTVIKNAGSLIVCALQGDDVRLAGDLLGTTREQSEALRVLQPGEAVASLPAIWPQPVRFSFPQLAALPVSEAERRRWAEQFCRQVTVLPEAGRSTAGAGSGDTGKNPASREAAGKPGTGVSLDAEAKRLLVLAAVDVPPPQGRLYQQAGLSRRRGSRAVAALEKQGLARRHRFSKSRRGGRLSVLEVTRRGWDLLEGEGLAAPRRPVTRGGWEHNLLARALGELGRLEGKETGFEHDLGGVRLDVTWRGSRGRMTAFQIGLSDPKREARAFSRAAALPGGSSWRFVAVCRDKSFVRALTAELRNCKVPDTGQVEMRLAGDLLEALYRQRGDKT